MRNHLSALLIFSALASTQAARPEQVTERPQLDIGVYTPREGLLFPLARLDGDTWEDLEPDPSLASIEGLRKNWVLARSVPQTWYVAALTGGSAETLEGVTEPVVQESSCGTRVALEAPKVSARHARDPRWRLVAAGNAPLEPIVALDPRSPLARQVVSAHYLRKRLESAEARVAREWREAVSSGALPAWSGDQPELVPKPGVHFWVQQQAREGPLVYMEREQPIAAAGRRTVVRGFAFHLMGGGETGITGAAVDDGTPSARRWLPLGAVQGQGWNDWLVVEERREGTRAVLYRIGSREGPPMRPLLGRSARLSCPDDDPVTRRRP